MTMETKTTTVFKIDADEVNDLIQKIVAVFESKPYKVEVCLTALNKIQKDAEERYGMAISSVVAVPPQGEQN